MWGRGGIGRVLCGKVLCWGEKGANAWGGRGCLVWGGDMYGEREKVFSVVICL